MTNGIGSVHVKRQKGKPTLIGYGQTPRGQQYPKVYTPLEVSEKDVKKFKDEIETAVKAMLPQESAPTP